VVFSCCSHVFLIRREVMPQVQVPARLPEWFKLAAPHAMFSSKEIAELFGIPQGSLYRLIAKGELPEPAKMSNPLQRGHRQHDYSLRWSKAQLVAQLRALRAQSMH
jgi:hypothetical protein